jgi:hypothetical protein
MSKLNRHYNIRRNIVHAAYPVFGKERKQRKEAAEKGNSRKTISRIKPERYKEKKEGRKKTLEKESGINKSS